MTISVACPDCGFEYQIKDAMAGKKIRCKKCEATINVPSDAEDEWDETPAPKSKSSRATSKGKKKRSGSSESGLLKWVALGVGAVLILGGIGYGVSRLLATGGPLNSNVGGVSWTSFTTADGHVTLKLPGDAKFTRTLPNGADTMSMTSGKITGSIASGMPTNTPHGNIQIETLAEAKKKFEMFTNVRLETLNGQPMIRATMKQGAIITETADFIVADRMYVAMLASPEPLDPAVVELFFNSIKTK